MPQPDYAVFFRANAHEIGLLPQPLPQKLLMFYGIYTQLEDNLSQVSHEADLNFPHMNAASVQSALNLQVRDGTHFRSRESCDYPPAGRGDANQRASRDLGSWSR